MAFAPRCNFYNFTELLLFGYTTFSTKKPVLFGAGTLQQSAKLKCRQLTTKDSDYYRKD